MIDKIMIVVCIFYIAIVISAYIRIKLNNNLNRYTYLAILFMPFLCIYFLFKYMPCIIDYIGRKIYVKTKMK